MAKANDAKKEQRTKDLLKKIKELEKRLERERKVTSKEIKSLKKKLAAKE